MIHATVKGPQLTATVAATYWQRHSARAAGRQARVNPTRAAAVATNGRSPCEWLGW